MKIAFWSHLRGQCGVTANMACICALSAIAGRGKNILLENHYNMNSLVSMLVSPDRMNMLNENGQYYEKYGIEYLLKRLYSGESGDILLKRAAIPLLYSTIFYLPQSYVVNREVFNYEFELVHQKLFAILEEFSDYVYIDTETNSNLSTKAILEDADLVVINLNQDPQQWEEVFDNYEGILHKSVFVIGKYQRECHWSMLRLRREFQIAENRIAAIPYNLEFVTALQEGRMLQFLNRNYQTALPETAFFMDEAKKASIMLQENSGVIRRMERMMARKVSYPQSSYPDFA